MPSQALTQQKARDPFKNGPLVAVHGRNEGQKGPSPSVNPMPEPKAAEPSVNVSGDASAASSVRPEHVPLS